MAQPFDPASFKPDFDPESFTPDAPVQTSALGEIGRGLKRGLVVGGEQAAGKALQILSPDDSAINAAGTQMVQNATNRGETPDYTMHPEQHGAIVNALAGGAEGLGSFLPTMAVGAVQPEIGLGMAATQMATTGAQDTYERVLKATGDPDQAKTAALESGAIQGVGGLVGGALVGRAARGLVTGALSKAAPGIEGAMAEATSKNVFKPALANMAENAVALPLTVAAMTAGSAAVEKAHGVNVDPIDAALGSIPSSLGMATLLGPLSVFGAYRAAQARDVAAKTITQPVAPGADGTVDPNALTRRNVEARKLYGTIKGADPQAAQSWLDSATQAIEANQPVDISSAFPEAHAKMLVDQAEAARQQVEQAIPALPHLQNDTMFVFPDGSTGTQSQIDEHINTLPESERVSARANMMYGAREAAPEDQTAQPAVPEAPPATAPVSATPEDTLKAQLQEFGATTVPAARIAKLAEMTPEEQIAHLDNMDLENSKAAYAEGLAKYHDSLKQGTQLSVLNKPLHEMTADELDAALPAAQAKDARLEQEAVTAEYGPEEAQKFAALGRRAKDKWWNANATEAMDKHASMHSDNAENVGSYRDAQHDFDPESAAHLGRSIAMKIKDSDSPNFVHSPEWVTLKNAFEFAAKQGWSFDDVMKGAGERAHEWAGSDAAELFPRLEKYFNGEKKNQRALKGESNEVTANENQGAGAERPAPEAAVNAGGAEQPVERPTAQPVEKAAEAAAKPVEPEIVSVKQIRGTGETHVTTSTGDTIKIYKDDATGSMGLPGWHWDESGHNNPGPSQRGHVTTYLADTKSEALKELKARLPRILKLKGVEPVEKAAEAAAKPVERRNQTERSAKYGLAKSLAEQDGKISIGRLQRAHSQIGESEAARLIEQLKQDGVIDTAVVKGTHALLEKPAEQEVAPEVAKAEPVAAKAEPEEGIAPETAKEAWDQMRHDEYGDAKEIPRYEDLNEAHRDLWDQGRQSGADFEELASRHRNNQIAERTSLRIKPEHIKDEDWDVNFNERADGVGAADAAKTQGLLKDAKTLGDALRIVRDSLDPKLKRLADKLLSDPKAVAGKFELSGRSKTNINGNAVLGEHYRGDVVLHNGAGVTTLLHEAVHAKTAWGLRNDEVFRNSVKELYDAAKAAFPNLQSIYAFKNLDEFLAMANTDPKTQEALDTIPSIGGKSLFGRLIDAVRSFLGMQPGQTSLLRDVMKVTEQAPAPRYDISHAAELGVQHSETTQQALDAPKQILDRVISGVKDQVKNLRTMPSGVLKQLAYAHTINHLAEAYKSIAPGIGKFKGALDQIQGTHKALEIESALVGRQGNEWEAQIKRKPTGSQDVMKQSQLSQRATLDAIDPRFDPSKPLEGQKWYKDLARHHANAKDLAMAQEFMKASYKAENEWVAKMTPAELTEYRQNRANLEKLWDENGRMRAQIKSGTGGKPETISGQDVFHREEFRMKQLGLRYNDESVKTWYENFHDEAFGPKETDVAKMREQIAASKSKFPAVAKAELQRLGESRTNIMASPYFHMFRPGDFYVKYKGKDGKTYLNSFESEMAARRAWGDLAAQGKAAEDGFKGGRWADMMRDNDVASASALRDFINRATERAEAIYGVGTPEAKSEVENMRNILEQTVLSSLTRGNNRTASAKRVGYEGALPDMRRSFATRTMYAHNAIAVLTHTREASQALQDLAQQARDAGTTTEGHPANPELQSKLQVLSDEMRTRQQLFTKPVNAPLLDALTNLNYNFYLGLSPAYLIRNATQPWVYTLPMLGGRYGFMDSARALTRHSGTAIKILGHVMKQDFFNPIFDMSGEAMASLGLRPDQMKTLQALAASGKADATFAYDTGAIARGQTGKLSQMQKKFGVFAHYSEVLNRIATALAAHDLEFARSGSQELAQAQAFKMVDDTQMDYSPTNKARMLGKHGVMGKATPLLTAFQQFNFQVLELMSRMTANAVGKNGPEEANIARKQIAGMMGTTAIFAGTLGLPFANVIAAAWDKLTGDDNNPSDIKSEYRTWLSETFGPELGEVIARGVPRAMNFDMSSGVGMQDVLPFSQFLADRRAWKDRLDTLVVGGAGPAYGMLQSMARGADQISSGNVWKGVESVLPHALTGVAKAAEMQQKGQFTDSKGNVLPIQATGWDELVQSFGLTPAHKAEIQEQSFAYKQHQALLNTTRGKLMQDAQEARGTADMPAAIQKIQAWNQAHPDMPVRNLNSAARAQAQKYQMAKQSGTGMLVSRRALLGLNGYSFANEGELQ